MKTALVGHTGFVGSCLAAQKSFECYFNSSNFKEMKSQSFDLVICAGISATKWLANKNPDEDLEKIKRLLDILDSIQVKKFIHISTIDVYQRPINVDESSIMPQEQNHAYGRNRAFVETFVNERFSDHHIIRLPGLFGVGLKKNIIYDLIYNNCIEAINAHSVFQFYNLERLYSDIKVTVKNELKLLNLVTEPIQVKEILKRFFPNVQVHEQDSAPAVYDMRSLYAKFWKPAGNYMYSKEEVLSDLGKFIVTSEQMR